MMLCESTFIAAAVGFDKCFVAGAGEFSPQQRHMWPGALKQVMKSLADEQFNEFDCGAGEFSSEQRCMWQGALQHVIEPLADWQFNDFNFHCFVS